MLHRITAIGLLCAGLIFAGVPALACCADSAPPDCCSQGQQSPEQDNQISALGSAATGETCCAAGATQTTTIAASSAAPDVRKHSQHPDTLALIATFVLWVADYSAPPSKVGLTAAIYLPTYSSLYLSSGRLRL